MKEYIAMKSMQALGASLPSLAGLYNWAMNQGKYGLYIAIVIGAVVMGFKREIGKAIGVLLGLGSLVFIITNLDMVTGWLSNLGKMLGGS